MNRHDLDFRMVLLISGIMTVVAISAFAAYWYVLLIATIFGYHGGF